MQNEATDIAPLLTAEGSRLLEAVGHPVLTLTRVQVGPVLLRDLKPGRMRPLNGKEIGELYSAAGL